MQLVVFSNGGKYSIVKVGVGGWFVGLTGDGWIKGERGRESSRGGVDMSR